MSSPAKTRAVSAQHDGPVPEIARTRDDFPILGISVRGQPLAYLDNAATSQKPRVVIDAVTRYYAEENANVHRGVHYLSEVATARYEDARETAREFINARSPREIVFLRGTTEAINLVAHSFLGNRIEPGDEIVITHLEHHSNIVPWQLLCEATGAVLRVAPIDKRGVVDIDAYAALLGPRVRLAALSHVSNALGTVNPAAEMVRIAKERNIPVLFDGAQAVPHLPVDVQALDCDFYAFSGHKMFAPMGIGVLYARESLLAKMPPWQGGGEMIRRVSFEGTEYSDIPTRFEAGTPNVGGAIGLAAAMRYLKALDPKAVVRHETDLLDYATRRLTELPGLEMIGTAPDKVSVASFIVDGLHPHDIGTFLDQKGVAVRTGHHCAMPVMDFFGVPATTRASFAVYNTIEEVDRLVDGLAEAIRFFR